MQPQKKGAVSTRRHPAAPIWAELSTPPRRRAPPRGLSAPSPRGKKLAAANGRPERRLTSASRRAALPGDSSGVNVLSPPPTRPSSGCRALYRARARGQRSSSSSRAAVGSARGGWAGHPGARRSALCFSLLTPHSRHPQTSPRCFLLFSPQPTFSPSLARYSSWLEPGRAHPRAPPDLPARNSDHYKIQKHVDHTSVRLLRYRLIVQGTRGSKERGRRASRKPFEFSDLTSAFGGTPSPS